MLTEFIKGEMGLGVSGKLGLKSVLTIFTSLGSLEHCETINSES